MIKKFCSIFVVFTLVLCLINSNNIVFAEGFRPSFIVNSEGAYMINIDTGNVIYSKNSNKILYPASTTKIMTAALTIEYLIENNLDFNTELEVPQVVIDQLYLKYYGDYSNVDMRTYEVVRYIDMLYALMLPSACEVASILAYHVGGESEQNFVNMMNEKAKELGMENTNYVNPHGLFDEQQYTTAYDLSIIARYAYDLPRFMDICSTYTYEMPATNKHPEPRTIAHTNSMMNKNSDYYYEYIKGIKTGYLDEAGRCLVSTASKDGFRYLLVTLNAPVYDNDGVKLQQMMSFVDHKALYEWVFDTFEYRTVLSTEEDLMEFKVEQGQNADFVRLRSERNVIALLPKTLELSTIQKIKPDTETLTAPVAKGTVLGKMELKLADETLDIVNLIAAEDIELSQLAYYMNKTKEIMGTSWFKAAVIVLAGIILIYSVARGIQKAGKRKRRNSGKKIIRRK